MFVRYVSHEVRTPLNTVLMGLHLLKKELNRVGSLEEDIIPIISDIEISCEIAIQQLSSLLDYEKLESGIMTLDRKELLAWPVIRDTIGPFHVQVRVIRYL